MQKASLTRRCSLFPVLTSVAAIFVQTRTGPVQRSLGKFLEQILPPGTEDIVLQQFRLRGQRPAALLVVALLLSLWAASSVIKSLIDGFNAAYRVPRNRSLLRHQSVGIMLAVLAIFPMLGASSLILFGGAWRGSF